jgi:hypothetical protein
VDADATSGHAGGLDVSKVSAWKELFLRHSSLIISVASVAIALMALFFTIYNARLDRHYKELGIKPFLHLHVETSDFHVGFLNAGLGPAEIISVATKFEPDRCLHLGRRKKLPTDDPAQIAGKVLDLMNPINQYFADPLDQLVQPDSIWEPPNTPRLYGRTLTPGEIIPPGQEVIIFELQKETLEIVEKKLQTLSAGDYNKVMRRFITRAQSMPYYVNFCSLTGEYCVNQVEENCGT